MLPWPSSSASSCWIGAAPSNASSGRVHFLSYSTHGFRRQRKVAAGYWVVRTLYIV